MKNSNMKTCVIFCAGGFSALAEPIGEGDYVIAADGGYAHTQALGQKPDAVLGDFDSLGYVPEDAIRFPVEKDDTDAMLAVRLGLEQGCDRFLLYGSLDGARLEHTVANFQTLAFLRDHGCTGYLIGRTQVVTLLEGQTLCFPKTAVGYLSVFAYGGAATVTLRGVQYPLERGQLTPNFPLGVSNRFQDCEATVSAEEGRLLPVWQLENGLPERK